MTTTALHWIATQLNTHPHYPMTPETLETITHSYILTRHTTTEIPALPPILPGDTHGEYATRLHLIAEGAVA